MWILGVILTLELVVRRLRTSGFFQGNFFEAVLTSKRPQRPYLTSPLAFSWLITSVYWFLGGLFGWFGLLLTNQRRR